MKKNGYDVDECCYAEMTKYKVYEQSESPLYDEPYRNGYENAKWNSNGYDQSGMKGK